MDARTVFSYEHTTDHGMRLLVEGPMTEEMLDALSLYIKHQRRRLTDHTEQRVFVSNHDQKAEVTT